MITTSSPLSRSITTRNGPSTQPMKATLTTTIETLRPKTRVKDVILSIFFLSKIGGGGCLFYSPLGKSYAKSSGSGYSLVFGRSAAVLSPAEITNFVILGAIGTASLTKRDDPALRAKRSGWEQKNTSLPLPHRMRPTINRTSRIPQHNDCGTGPARGVRCHWD